MNIKFEWVGDEDSTGYRKFILSNGDSRVAKIARPGVSSIHLKPGPELKAYLLSKAVKEGIRDIALKETGDFRAYDDQFLSVIEQIK